MKKRNILITVILVLMFAMFALGSSESTNTDQGAGSVNSTEALTNLGNYNVEIHSCRLAKDYQDKDIVIVKYIYTNVNGNNPTSFMIAFNAEVYQNGVGLNESYFVNDNANYTADNQTKDIKKGATIEVEVAYELNDISTDIEVEVTELFSFSDSSVTKTFSIA